MLLIVRTRNNFNLAGATIVIKKSDTKNREGLQNGCPHAGQLMSHCTLVTRDGIGLSQSPICMGSCITKHS